MAHISELLAQPAEQPEGTQAPTGLSQLDEMVGGFNPGRLWILTGSPGQGRTTLLTQWAAVLATQHRWLTIFLAPREESARCVSRLVSAVGQIPLTQLMAGSSHAPDPQRVGLARNQLEASPLHVEAGGPVGVPAWEPPPSSPHALLIDDVDIAYPFIDHLRRLADGGAFVAVTLPRHLLVRGDRLDDDLDPTWGRAADLVVELRTVGASPGVAQLAPGTGRLTVLKNRRGPLFNITVSNEVWRTRFRDLTPEVPDR